MSLNEALSEILIGRSELHLVPWLDGTGHFVHRNMRNALETMTQAAAESGIQLEVASAFRSFERQLAIWNAKATGQRPLLDDAGRLLEFSSLSGGEIIQAILRWSALPGCSRHHWGTDIDVYDRATVDADYKVQLTVAESFAKFEKLHRWLDANMQRFGFFRPYARDLGGIAPEPWHLSYQPVAQTYYQDFSVRLLEQTIRASDLALKDQVLENLPQIFERYFLRISLP